MPSDILSKLNRQHVLLAMRDLDDGFIHSFGAAKRYELIHDEKKYPPKAVVGIAVRHLIGETLSWREFSGGRSSGQANAILEQLGFRVVALSTSRSNCYVTSLGDDVKSSAGEEDEWLWFNMWRKRMWPYDALEANDSLYWYAPKRRQIIWKTVVESVIRFEYEEKRDAKKHLNNWLAADPDTDPYFRSAPPNGYCLAFKVRSRSAVAIDKPSDFSFPRCSWLRLQDRVPPAWTSFLIGYDPPITNKAFDLELPERVAANTYRIVRDTALARYVKDLHQHECQICGHTIVQSDGSRYAEVHHIQCLGEPHNGPDVVGNILCVCPNHHAEFDLGVTRIDHKKLRKREGHSINPRFVTYHNQHIFRQ